MSPRVFGPILLLGVFPASMGCSSEPKTPGPDDETSRGESTTSGTVSNSAPSGAPSTTLTTSATSSSGSSNGGSSAPLPSSSASEPSVSGSTRDASSSVTSTTSSGVASSDEATNPESSDVPVTSGTPEDTGSVDSEPFVSAGCGKAPTLKNSAQGAGVQENAVRVGNSTRQFIVRWPADYDSSRPYRVILGLHGAGGSGRDIAGDYFGLWPLAAGSTIFVALSAEGGLWSAQNDLLYVDEVLKQLDSDLCFDTTRVMLEGFSQGAAMAWTLACSRPGVFAAVVGHSGGGVAAPSSCGPVPYLGSLGLNEANNSQVTQTDRFAKWNGCTVETLPTAPTGGHVCTPYPGCPAASPVVWCSFDGGHTPSPTDAGERSSWMPERVWQFLSEF